MKQERGRIVAGQDFGGGRCLTVLTQTDRQFATDIVICGGQCMQAAPEGQGGPMQPTLTVEGSEIEQGFGMLRIVFKRGGQRVFSRCVLALAPRPHADAVVGLGGDAGIAGIARLQAAQAQQQVHRLGVAFAQQGGIGGHRQGRAVGQKCSHHIRTDRHPLPILGRRHLLGQLARRPDQLH